MDAVAPMSIQSDLARSGLVEQDIGARPIDAIERLACGIPPGIDGYAIPYYDIWGRPIQFYRTKLFGYTPKYKQIKDTPTHIYYPRGFKAVFDKGEGKRERPIILLTEGEKKATLACKMGFPTVAFGGVDAWRNRTIILPKTTTFKALKTNEHMMAAKVEDASQIQHVSGYATGFEDLIAFGLAYNVTFVLAFDSDALSGTTVEVQRALSVLGYELRTRGFTLSRIRQLTLPPIGDPHHRQGEGEGEESEEAASSKVGLDDYLLDPYGGPKKLRELIAENLLLRTAFPRHPNVQEYITKKLSAGRTLRKEMQHVSLALLCELDARGRRMYSADSGQFFYFDCDTAQLMKADINVQSKEQIQSTAFGRLLYREFGVAAAVDTKLTQWLGAQFASEDPVERVSPHRVIARPGPEEDIVRFQLNGSCYVQVDGTNQGFEILDNGERNVMFEESPSKLRREEAQATLEEVFAKGKNEKYVPNWWNDVLSKVRLKDHGKHQHLMSLLYYASPFLYRWRGTQLPIELIMGESGSGKSTLCELRLELVTGQSALRNAPNKLDDWYASVANTGGLHVTDNVQFTDKSIRQRLSDEICRLITEPNPHIEMRKLYANNELVRVRIDPIFVFTAIQQPFHNTDLIQRAILLELDKSLPMSSSSVDLVYEGQWKQDRIKERGGHAAWIAHHMYVLHRFFVAANKVWDSHYRAKHRLINLEQILVIMARDVFGMEWEWIPKHLARMVDTTIESSDWVLNGLCAFVDDTLSQKGGENSVHNAKDMVDWFKADDDFQENHVLTNARSLGHYLKGNKHVVMTTAGLVGAGKNANREMYRVIKANRHKEKDRERKKGTST